jgi:hypothetical protein
MPDGRTYRRIEGTAALIGGWYLRMDTSTACLYHYQEYPVPSQALQDSFLAMPGDQISSYPCSKSCLSVDTATVLGMRTITKGFRNHCVYERPHTLFAWGIGLILESEYAGEGGGCPIHWTVTRELVYARVNGREFGESVGIVGTNAAGPMQVALDQNFPNPFNPVTTIGYSLGIRAFVSLSIFNALGQQVRLLRRGEEDAGHHQVRFDGSGLPSGIYYCRLQAAGSVQTKVLVLAR